MPAPHSTPMMPVLAAEWSLQNRSKEKAQAPVAAAPVAAAPVAAVAPSAVVSEQVKSDYLQSSLSALSARRGEAQPIASGMASSAALRYRALLGGRGLATPEPPTPAPQTKQALSVNGIEIKYKPWNAEVTVESIATIRQA